MVLPNMTKEEVKQALTEVLDSQLADGRYVDVSRIPLICQSIVGIHTDIKEIKETLKESVVTQEAFSPVKNIVYGMVGTILIGFFGAVVAFFLSK